MITLRRQAQFAAAFLASALLAATAAATGESQLPQDTHPDIHPVKPLVQAVIQPQPPIQPAEISPGAGALRAALTRQGHAAEAAQRFYEARGYRELWLAADGTATPAARALLAWAGAADANGLPVERYGVAALAARLDTAVPGAVADAAALEAALTRLFLTYGRDISSGLLEPRKLGRNFDIDPRRPDPAVLLAGIAASSDVAAYLDALAPADPAYGRLLALYAEMRAIARNGDWGPQIAEGETLHPGDRSPRVEQLRARLIALGDMTATERVAAGEVINDATPPTIDPQVFDPALEAAVRRFQARHGLNTDSTVGALTLGALNASAAERAAQVAIGLERLRWLNYDLGARHIMINTAAFTMQVIENGAPVFTTRTVVGRAGLKYQTPEFNDELEFMVVNPYWNVPYSIAIETILPKLKEDPLHLEKNNMELLDAGLPASQIDWSQVTHRSFPGRVRQRPGPGNALGAVKFLFPNDYAIYMHDTPARNLFARDRRTYSFGCVRLQKPYEFARLLLSLQGKKDPARAFDRLRARSGEQWIKLKEKIPVYLTYRTAWVDSEGAPRFHADVYRRDRDVTAALTAAGVSVVSN